MAKQKFVSTVISKQIEEHFPVPFHLIGTPGWLDNSIDPEVLTNENHTRIYDPKDLGPVLQQCRKTKVLGIDSETGGDNKRDGLDPVAATSRMLIFQLGTPEMVHLIEPALVPEFKEILEDQEHLFITQNGVHDFKFTLAKYGVHFINYYYDNKKEACVPCLYDTMLAEQILSAGLFGVSVGLEELAEKYPPHRLISKAVRKEFIDMSGVLEYRHLYYAARDVYLLFDIRIGQLKEIQKHSGMWDRVQLEFCAVPGTADAELTGFELDEVRVGNTVEYYVAKAERIRNRVTEIFNDSLSKQGKKRNFVLPNSQEFFDLDSSSKKLEALLKMGFELKDTKRETLLALKTEIADLLGEYTECTKVISTYGEGLIGRKSKTTGRVHPEFNQLGSGDLDRRKGKEKTTTIATGRWSGDAQQFPRPEHILDPVVGEKAKDIKSLFATEYGKALETFNKPEEKK